MISIYDLKPKFQKMLQPFVTICLKSNISANFLTLASSGLTLVFCFLLVNIPLIAFAFYPFFEFLRMALNALDGMVATQSGTSSKKGSLLNEGCDIFNDTVLGLSWLYLIIQTIGLLGFLIFSLSICFSLVSEVAGIMGSSLVNKRVYGGPFGKSDKALFFSLAAILCLFSNMVVVLGAVCLISLVLSALTLKNKFDYILREGSSS